MRGKRIPLLAAFLLGAVITVALLKADKEPKYQRRTLSDWYGVWLAAHDPGNPSPVQAREAALAIKRIGTNALPLIVKRMRQEHSALLNSPRSVLKLLPASVFERPVSALFGREHRFDSGVIFDILGPDAAPAAPELGAILTSTRNRGLAHSAAWNLATIGKEGAPYLIEALRHPELPGCCEAAKTLSTGAAGRSAPFDLGTNISGAVPLLTRHATAQDTDLAVAAIGALGRLQVEPAVTIPALTNSLQSTNSKVRRASVAALGSFGAGTELLPALVDKEESVRSLATNWLAAIHADGSTTNSPASSE